MQTHRHYTDLNAAKHQILLQTLEEYKRVADIILSMMIKHFLKTGKIMFENYKDIDTVFSERYKSVIWRQVHGMFESFLSNRKNDFKTAVKKSSISKDVKDNLLSINRNNEWFKVNFEKDETLKLANKIMDNILRKNSYPSVDNINMLINTKIYTLEDNKATKYRYWIKLRVYYGPEKHIMIPIKENTRFENTPGRIANSINICFDRTHEKNIRFIHLFKYNEAKEYNKVNKTIGVDIGVCTLFQTSDGQSLGNDFKRKLKYYDDKLQKLIHELNKRKIKLTDSNKYNELVNDMREFIKNTVNRYLNVLFNSGYTLVFESLKFIGSKFSKQTNRLLNNCGIGQIKKRLEESKKEVNIEYINPAYTSQECFECGYIDKNNRPTQSVFKCCHCGNNDNADNNAAKVILKRFQEGNDFTYVKYYLVKGILMKQFHEREEAKKVMSILSDAPPSEEKNISHLVL